MLHTEEHTVEVDRHLSLPVGQRHLDDAAADPDPGVVDQDVESFVVIGHCGYDGDPGLLGGDVVGHVLGGAAGGVDLGRHGVSCLVLDVGDDDLGTFFREADRTRPADARGAPCDDRHFACNPTRHVFLPEYERPTVTKQVSVARRQPQV